MNVKTSYIIILFLSLKCYSQHSEKFKTLSSNIKPIDTLAVNLKFNNGKQREIAKLYTYVIGNNSYNFYSGKRITYYKNGTIAYESEYDDFGNILNYKWYDGENNLWYESETIKIDTEAIDIDYFLEYDDHLTVTITEKIYRFDKVTCEYYLKKEGQRINGKKNGIWRTFHPDGNIKKEKKY